VIANERAGGDGGDRTLTIERRPLGRSGCGIARVALGCGNFGGVGSEPRLVGRGLSEAQAFELMDAAWAMGITHFDTADSYGAGRSEAMIGRWRRARRTSPQLTTKTYFPLAPGGDEGLAPERIHRQLTSSLTRLGVEHVDLYLAHWPDPTVPFTCSSAALEREIELGRARAYGVSNCDFDQLGVAMQAGRPSAVQNGYSLLQRADEHRVLPLCRKQSVAYQASSPLCGGWLTGKYRRGHPFPQASRMTLWPELYEDLISERTFVALERFASFARRRHVSMAGLAIGWLLADPRVTQIVLGASGPQHLGSIREAMASPLDHAERDSLTRLFD
jgi:aryl-alcohol dehydrogenase-like predicted oxidoreductase